MRKYLLPLLGLLLFCAIPSHAAIAHDADSTSGNCGNVNTCAWNHTVTGTNPILWVACGWNDGFNGPLSVSSITYNSVAMTQTQTKTSTDFYVVKLFYLLAPATGTHQVSITLSNTIGTAVFFCGAVSFSGASQSAIDSAGTNTSIAGNIGVSLNETTINANSWIVDANVHGDQGNAETPNGTQVASSQQKIAFGFAMSISYQGPIVTPAATSDGWAIASSTTNWALVASSLQPAAAGGGGGGFGGKAGGGGKMGFGFWRRPRLK
jgi:hypothetical protein